MKKILPARLGLTGSSLATLFFILLIAPTASGRLGVERTFAQTNTWTLLTSGTTNELRSVHFLNESEGWVAGANVTLLRTSDGGTNWSAITNTRVDVGNGFHSVRVIDQNTIWVGGRAAAIRSTNSGMTWGGAQWTSSAGLPFQNSLFASSAAVAWGVGPGPRTHLRHEFLTSFFFSEVFSQTFSEMNDVYFVSGGPGWSVGNGGQIIRLSNATGGATLTPQTSGTTQTLNGLYMLDADTGWVVGNGGTILKTSNGGGAWNAQNSGTNATLRDVHFADANRGWIVGDGGTILTTSDGGATWTPEASGVTVDLRSVFFPSANVGYAVGANGTILKRSGAAPATVASVSAASFTGAELAGESIVSLFGANLAASTESASSTPLPTTLAGTSVRVRDSAGREQSAPLFFASPGQINLLLPADLANGAATFSVMRDNAVIATGTTQIAAVAPGLFAANANGQGVAAAVVLRVKADGTRTFEPVARLDAATGSFVAVPIDLGPATDEVFLLLYGTGIRGRSALPAVTATVGGTNMEVGFAGAQGELVGLDQVNLRLARSLSGRGELDVRLMVDGKATNIVKINIGGTANTNPTPVLSNFVLNTPTFNSSGATLSGRFDFSDADGDIAFNGNLTNSAKLRLSVRVGQNTCTLELTGPFLNLRGQSMGTVNFSVTYGFRNAIFLPVNVEGRLLDVAGNVSNPVTTDASQWFCGLAPGLDQMSRSAVPRRATELDRPRRYYRQVIES